MQTFRRNLANSARTHLVYSNLKRDLSTKLYVRGVGLFGALGISDELHDEPNFKELEFSKEYGKLKSISAGWGHSGALFDSGDAFIWGRPFEFSTIMRLNRIYAISSSVGRMFSKSTNSMFGSDNGFFPLPVRITTTGKVESIACSAGLTVCLNDKGEIWAFGQNTWMQCGFDSKPNFHIYEPVKIAVPKAKKIAVGLQHCLSLTEDGKIFAWGKTDKGRLGVSYDLKKEEFAAPPKEVFLPHPRTGRSLRAKEISAGFAHSAALADDGAVYIWGKGLSLTETEKGKSLFKLYDHQTLPRRIDLPNNLKATSLYCSNFQTVIVGEDKSVWIMGVSDEDRNTLPYPVRVQTEYLPATNDATTTSTTPNNNSSSSSSNQCTRFDFFLSSHDQLIKGHNKIVLSSARPYQLARRSDSAEAPLAEGVSETANCFEIMLHEGEAFLLPASFTNDPLFHGADQKIRKILDYSAGWKHDLLLLED